MTPEELKEIKQMLVKTKVDPVANAVSKKTAVKKSPAKKKTSTQSRSKSGA